MKTKYRIIKEKYRPFWFSKEKERFEIQKYATFLYNDLAWFWFPIKIDGIEYYPTFESAEKVLLDYQNPPEKESNVIKEYEF